MIEIEKYLHQSLVLFLQANTRDEALREMVERAAREGCLPDKEAFYQALLAREKIVSTGIGMGIAVPHARMPAFEDFFILIGIHKKGIAWDSLDDLPAKLIFMVGGPDDKQIEYLQILSRLTAAIKEEERRKQMLILEDPQAIVELFHGW